MPQVQTADQLQINLINQLCKLEYKFNKVEQTIILYDLFDTAEGDSIYLHNLHTVAQLLIDSSAEVAVELVEVGHRQWFDKLNITRSSANIYKADFQVEYAPQGQAPLLTDICLYEIKGETKIRVVVIPIQKDLSDISKLKKEQEQLQKENVSKHKEFTDKHLQGQELKAAQASWNKEKEEKFKLNCHVAKDKHLKMFKIEAFLSTVLLKTETYSIAASVEISMRRLKSITKCYSDQFLQIFNVPKEETPQFIFYGYDPKAPLASQAQHQLVTTRFDSVMEGRVPAFKVGKIDCWNTKYFYKPVKVKTQIYQNMESSDNKAISKVIQDFVDSWNNITVRTASCFATIVKLVNKTLNGQKNKDKAGDNSGTDLNTSTSEIQSIMSFPEVFQDYIHESLWFPQKQQLKEFYTDERLGKKITVEKGTTKIPFSIEPLIFISFFYKMLSEFSEKYKKAETQSKNDQIVLLNLWKFHLKELYELVNSFNKTFLDTESNKANYQAQDMQKFFNFLMFTLDSSEKIKKITGRDIATASSFKALFEQFRPKKDRILSFIIANQNAIKPDQPIQYYQLYLLIIKQNASQDIQNDLQYIQLHIHEFKAFRIATQYIWDNQKVVEAIRSYALICLKYEKLNQNKRKLIKIQDIERRMARLLKIVKQEQFAADIYFKNRELHFANNCCKQVLSRYNGDQKAYILIKWGEKFEKEFEFELATNYFLMAYSYARSPLAKQRALQRKMRLFEKKVRLPTEDEKAKHEKYRKQPATEDSLKEFCSEINLKQMHSKLYKYLVWDNEENRSLFCKEKNEDVDPELSMLASEEALEA